MPRKEEKKAGAPEWMCTFSDMMSLLLCFFVLLFSLSTIEKKKLIQAEGSLRKAFGGLPAPYITETIPDKKEKPEISKPSQPRREKSFAKDELRQEEERKVKSRNLQEVIDVTGTEQGITFRLSGDLTFEQGSAELTSAGILALLYIIDELNQFPKNPIKISGHSDSTKSEDEPYKNWTLSAKRAYNVMKFMTDVGNKWGQVAPQRISYESYGEYKPIASNDTEIGRKLNRRVDITLTQTDAGDGTFYTDQWLKNPRTPIIDPSFFTQQQGVNNAG